MFTKDFISKYYTNSVQSAFCRIRLKDYFDLLDKIDKSGFYRDQYEQIKEYTKLNEFCKYELSRSMIVPYREDVTVGEMLYAANELLNEADDLRKSKENYNGSEQEDAGKFIVYSILIYPLSDEQIIGYLEKRINDDTKGD